MGNIYEEKTIRAGHADISICKFLPIVLLPDESAYTSPTIH